jgi:hypothetical protein
MAANAPENVRRLLAWQLKNAGVSEPDPACVKHTVSLRFEPGEVVRLLRTEGHK